MREKIGYFVAFITLLLFIAPAIIGKDVTKEYPVETGRIVLVILGVALLWRRLINLLIKLSLNFRKFIFRLFVSDIKEDIKSFVKSLADEMEPEIRQIISRLRPQNMLNYELKGPILKKEGYRHVSARVETIQLLLEGILNGDPNNSDKLRDIGRRVGDNFVQTTWPDMSEFMLKQRGGTIENLDDKLKRIRLWADMEITAGWGEFDTDLKIVKNGIFGLIKIRECFLSAGRDDKKVCLCPFLEGYLESMLSGLAGSSIKVTEHSCGRSGGVDKICIFKVEPLK